MRVMTWFFLLLSSHSLVQANEAFITRIHSIDLAKNTEKLHLMRFENARVGLAHNLIFFKNSHAGDLVKVKVDKKQKILFLKKLKDNEEVVSTNTPFVTNINYYSTLIEGSQETLQIFKELRIPKKNSQSYNRAHIWAFEQYQRRGLQSMKAFIFFTDDYIRNNSFKWWFQAAPYVTYLDNEKRKEKVIESSIATTPLTLGEWSHLFIGKEKFCKRTSKLSMVNKSASKAPCYIMKENMFYWHPNDLQKKEEFGIEKVTFFEWEIKTAYKNSFGLNYP